MQGKSQLWRARALIVVFLTCSMGLVQWVWSEATPVEPEQLDRLVMEAKSKEEHENLAHYFEQEAKALQAKADRHEKLAEAFEKGGSYEKVKGFMLQHCNAMIRNYRAAAEDNLALANMHRQLAAEAR